MTITLPDLYQVCDEFALPRTTPFPSGFYGLPGFPLSGPFSLMQAVGLSKPTAPPTDPSNPNPPPNPTPGSAVFTPDGGEIAGEGVNSSQVSVACDQNAIWNYTRTSGGPGTSVTVPSGGTSRFIGFTLQAGGSGNATTPRNATWTLTGTSAGVTRNFTVSLYASGNV
jgi:hypothetical protein